MGNITWLVGPDLFQRKLYLDALKGVKREDKLESPETKTDVDNWLRAGSLIPVLKVMIDPSKFNRQEDYPDTLANYTHDLVIISDESSSVLSGAFYKRLAKVADVKKCDYFKEYTDDLVNFISDYGRQLGLTVSGIVADLLIDLTGGDLWSIASELKKLSFVTSTPSVDLVRAVCWQGGGFSVDAGDLVRGNWHHFAMRSMAIDSYQLIWRIVDYLVRLLEFHQIYKLKGTLQGSRVPPRMVPKYESELRHCPEYKVLLGLRTMCQCMNMLKDLDSKAAIYHAIGRWTQL